MKIMRRDKLFFLPIAIFGLLVMATLFMWPLYGNSLLAENYWSLHLLFGVCFPLVSGYIGWIGRFTESGAYWSAWGGVAFTFAWSVYNEVWKDPRVNGIPFFEAWHHFAADMLGIVFFTFGCAWLLNHTKNEG